MTDRDFNAALLEVVQSFHEKIDGGFTDLRSHIDGKIDPLTTRVGAIETKQAHLSGAWKAVTIFGTVLGVLAGAMGSWILGLFGKQ